MAVLAADARKYDQALAAMDKEYAVAEKKGDTASMAADLQAKGNILMQAGKYDEAAKTFNRSAQMVETSTLSQELKNNATLLHHFNLTAVAIAKRDLAGAKSHAAQFQKGAEATKNSAQLKQAHELAGRIALTEKD